MNPRQRVKDLIGLAADKRTPDKERVISALKACELIQEYNLLEDPLDGIGDVLRGEKAQTAFRAVSKLRDVFTDPDVLGALKSVGETVKETRRRRRR